MSKNLIKTGYEPRVWNRTTSSMDEVVAAGTNVSISLREVTAEGEVTIMMVSGSADVEDVVFGQE